MSVDALTVERWVGEGIIKCAHIVLSSRVYRCSRTLLPRSRSNWFKLEVEEVDDAAPDLARYRHDVSQPLIIQILQQPDDASGRETIVEQWDMQFDGVPPTHHLRTVSYDDEPTKIYKRMCVMARTLYSYVRVLPAYRLYRACRDHRGAAYNLTYRLLRKPAPVLQPADVGGRQDGGPKCCHVERFAFAPIETMTGSLRISVQYQPQVAPLASVTAVPASIPQHIITDYIRAPGRAEQQKAAITRRMSSSAAPVLTGTVAPSQGGAGATGVSLLRAVRREGGSHSGSIPQQVDLLAPHAEEDDVEQTSTQRPDRREAEPCTPPSTTPRANPTDIPTRKAPLLVPTHLSSAPSDFGFARHSPMQEQFSPYTRHLACQVMKPPSLADEAWRQHSMSCFAQGSPLHRVSASSSASGSSPVAGSSASQDVGACRALVKHTSGRTAAARQMVVQLDSSLESCRLYTSPDGLLRASSGRSDVVSSRWGSPGAGGTEWASFHRQKLIEHPDSRSQVGRDGSRSDVPQTEQRTSFMGGGCLGDGDDGAGRSRVSTESSQSDGIGAHGVTSPGQKDFHGLQRQRSKLSTLARSHTHDLAASAPLPAQEEADRESEIKDFLLQLEQPDEFRSACGQEHCKTLVDVQIWAEDIMSRWGIGAG